MILLLKSQIETLNYFIDCMSLNNKDLVIIDFENAAWLEQITHIYDKIDENTIVISFNGAGIRLSFHNDINMWEYKNVKLFNILVDHPINFRYTLENNITNENTIVVDKYHKLYIEKYITNKSSVLFLPHGGFEQKKNIPYAKRNIDVFYPGSNQCNVTSFPIITYLPENGEELYDFAIAMVLKNHSLELIDVLKLYLLQTNITLENIQINEIIHFLHITVEPIYRREYKMETMRYLAMSGITVHVCGNDWEELAAEFPDKIISHGPISSERCIDLISDSKITLNIMPLFKNGSHERIYNAMLNHSICITDRSIYLEEKFQHEQNIIFFNINKLSQLAANIKDLLQDIIKAQNIIDNAYSLVSKSTWKDRLYTIITENFHDETII